MGTQIFYMMFCMLNIIGLPHFFLQYVKHLLLTLLYFHSVHHLIRHVDTALKQSVDISIVIGSHLPLSEVKYQKQEPGPNGKWVTRNFSIRELSAPNNVIVTFATERSRSTLISSTYMAQQVHDEKKTFQEVVEHESNYVR